MGLRSYAIERWGLAPDAPSKELGELLRKQLRRGALTRDTLLRLRAEDELERAENTAELRKTFSRYGIGQDETEVTVHAPA
ncbi:MAG TPA: hypothetical protein VMV10_21805 [Pirellulales bacterium]|nr:hypothetical protein [Pirellulales bacterium]